MGPGEVWRRRFEGRDRSIGAMMDGYVGITLERMIPEPYMKKERDIHAARKSTYQLGRANNKVLWRAEYVQQ